MILARVLRRAMGWLLPFGIGWYAGTLLLQRYFAAIVYSTLWPAAATYQARQVATPILCGLFVLFLWRQTPKRGGAEPAAQRAASGSILNDIHDTAERITQAGRVVSALCEGVFMLIVGLILLVATVLGMGFLLRPGTTDMRPVYIWIIGLTLGWCGLGFMWQGFRVIVFVLKPSRRGPQQSDVHGTARTATADDLRRKGILR